MIIYAVIDVIKGKQDCLVVESDGVILFESFTIPNNKQSWYGNTFLDKIISYSFDRLSYLAGDSYPNAECNLFVL